MARKIAFTDVGWSHYCIRRVLDLKWLDGSVSLKFATLVGGNIRIDDG